MKTTAVFPGSFDPVTKGHLDVINRARLIFDRVIVLVLSNVDKRLLFSLDERVNMVSITVNELSNVSVDRYDGLLVEYIRSVNNAVIIKGIRSISDFQYEFEMASVNKMLDKQVETIFLPSYEGNRHISSSLVKHLLHYDGDISWLVSDKIKDMVKNKISKDYKV